jgi:hypothetical protein
MVETSVGCFGAEPKTFATTQFGDKRETAKTRRQTRRQMWLFLFNAMENTKLEFRQPPSGVI